MKINLAGLRKPKLIRKELLFVTLAIIGIGLSGFMLQNRYAASRAIDSNRLSDKVEEQQDQIAEISEAIQIQNPGAGNPNAKPGEVGEILSDQPNKGIRYIRAGTLVISPTTLICYVGGYSCSTFTMSASDGKPIMSVIEVSNSKIGVSCRGDCYGATQKSSLKLGLEFSRVGPGTYPLNLEATHIDSAGNHLIYFGSITLAVKEPAPDYVPPPEPTYNLGTPPYPVYQGPPCGGTGAIPPACDPL